MLTTAAGIDRLQRSLAAAMNQRGDWPERSPWTRVAVDALPRYRFAPDRVWRWVGHAYVPVDQRSDPAGWASEVHPGPDTATVTEVS
ncbi:hypothetical protein ACH4L5_05375 [Streptomyces sp. NPDC017405]|uniref:hypothetical protein n=1 Tax=unclassified Streptomyces TaxID=2593676 RepID=UPI0037A645D4